MKRIRERNGEGEKVEKDISRSNHQQNEVLKNAANDASCNAIGKKKRRMSKKERKNLKQKMNIQKKSKLEEGNFVRANNNIGETLGNDDDIEGQEERTYIECMKTYEAIDVPKEPSIDLISQFRNTKGKSAKSESAGSEGKCRTLGKWFPNAIVMKTTSYTNTGQLISNSSKKNDLTVKNPKSSLVLFYQYTTSPNDNTKDIGNGVKTWDHRQLQLLMTYLHSVARHRNIGGRIRVAPETA